MTDETPTVENPEGLLAAYNALKADIKVLREQHAAAETELGQLKESLANDEWKPKALNAELKLALQGAGIKDAGKVLKYINAEGIDLDADGNLTGFDDAFKQWKEDLPAVFDPKVRAGGKADATAKDVAEPKTDPLRAAVHNALSGAPR